MTAAPATLLIPAALVSPPRPVPASLAALARRVAVADEVAPTGPPPHDPGHLAWLHRSLGLAPHESVTAAARVSGAVAGRWRVDPVHLHLARDHLVLTDPARLALDPQDARALADAVADLFVGEGLALHADDTGWTLHESDPAHALRLRTRPLLGALGRNIDAWMPSGDDARRWKRLLNEVQMTWFAHPVNAAREARGEPVVNGLWLEGRVPAQPSAATIALARALDRGAPHRGAVTADLDGTPLVMDTALLDAHLGGDPQDAARAWTAIGDGPIAAIAAASPPWQHGARIVLAGESGWRTLQVAAQADWRFWRRPDPSAWLIEPGEPAESARRPDR